MPWYRISFDCVRTRKDGSQYNDSPIHIEYGETEQEAIDKINEDFENVTNVTVLDG